MCSVQLREGGSGKEKKMGGGGSHSVREERACNLISRVVIEHGGTESNLINK